MGYQTIVDIVNFEFANKEEAERFMRELDDTGGNPFFENCEIDELQLKDTILYGIELFETVVKLQDYHKWIPYIATFKVEALIDFYGDEPFDIWRVEYYNNGEFKVYKGYVEYEETPLELM